MAFSGSQCVVNGDNDLLHKGEYAANAMIRVNDFLQPYPLGK
jgi:hypothetical protein